MNVKNVIIAWYADASVSKRRQCGKIFLVMAKHTDIKVGLRGWKSSFVRKVNIRANSLYFEST